MMNEFLLVLLITISPHLFFFFSLSTASASMTINGESIESNHHHHHHHQQQQQTDSNEPVESFYLSKEEEMDWLNKNTFFFERKESIKRKSISTSSILSSISLKSTPGTSSIIGLPKPQKSCFTIPPPRKNCKPSKARFFPKRSNRNKSSSVPPPSEPSSPKVSCIGRVRSKKEQRSRSLRIHHNRGSEEKTETKNPKPNKNGFWSNFKAVLRIGCQKPNVNVKRKEEKEEELSSSSLKKTEKVGRNRRRTLSEPPPVFSELKRFSSGRKSWGGGELSSDDDGDEFDLSLNRSGGQCSKNGEANNKRSVPLPPLFGELKRFASGRKSE